MGTNVRTPHAAGAPRLILRGEGLFLFVAAGWAFQATHLNWALFAMLFLAPDLGMLGYLLNPKVGAAVYNFTHTTLTYGFLAAAGYLMGLPIILSFGLIGLAHVGFDRCVGYGLKYPSAFGQTHLGVVGKVSP